MSQPTGTRRAAPASPRARGVAGDEQWAWLSAWVAAGEDARAALPAGSREETARRLDAVARACEGAAPPFGAPPRDLVARPCPRPAPRVHADGLAAAIDALREHAGAPAARAAAGLHASWLRWWLRPHAPEAPPLVTVVVPVFDGLPWVLDGVAAALAQSYPRVEVLVVDDGSRDGLAGALRPFGERVRLVSKPNGGVASARNLGVARARGAYVHFVDADDVLDRTTVEEKVAALGAVPDAELCTSRYRSLGDNGVKAARLHVPPAIGDALCPTRDLMITAVRRFAFHFSTVLLARAAWLETGPLDEQLRNGEDSRYWFRLGCRGTKVVAIDRELNTRRFLRGSLTSDPRAHHRSWAVVGLMNLHDLLVVPARWILVGSMLRRFTSPIRWRLADRLEGAELDALRERVVAIVDAWADGEARDGLSPRPVLAVIGGFLRAREVAGAPRAPDGFWTRLSERVEASARTAAARSARDVEVWTRGATHPALVHDAAEGLRDVYGFVDRGLREGCPVVPVATLGELSRRWPAHRERERWDLIARLARGGGDAAIACARARRLEPWLAGAFGAAWLARRVPPAVASRLARAASLARKGWVAWRVAGGSLRVLREDMRRRRAQ